MIDATRHIGLDLGGTNVKWVIAERSGEEWRTLDRGQVRTDVSAGERSVVEQLGRLALELRDRAAAAVTGGAEVTGAPVVASGVDRGAAREPASSAATAEERDPASLGPASLGPASLGVAVPGLYIPETGVVTFLTNVPGDWSATPVGGPLADRTGLPTAIVNDARAFGLAELRFGAGRGVRSFVGLTLGTGIGGVFAVEGRVIQGYRGQAGELGHQTIDPDGPWCGCGNRGCVEAYTRADQLALACGAASPEEAIAAARAGDRRAMEGLAEVGRYLGIGIANAITVLTPDRVILGGGWSSAAELIIEPIRAELRRRVITTPVERVEIVLAELGTWAGAIGAAVHGAERAAAAAAVPLAGTS